MFSKVNTAVCIGVEGKPVVVETEIFNGLPNMNIVGLASSAVVEARERIRTAIINSDYKYPQGRIIVNMTPANFRKNGSSLDLPIAIGLLASSLYVSVSNAMEYGIIGELSLDGEVLGIDGVLPMVFGMSNAGVDKIIVPHSNYNEASLVEGVEIIPVKSLQDAVEVINGSEKYKTLIKNEENRNSEPEIELDFADIKGQENAKRAITIAVTGRHGLLMIGSPGCGKSMLAKRIPTIMPPMSQKELIEVSIVNSIVGRNNGQEPLTTTRPFRSPHSSIGRAGLLGGGNYPIPGEITLAHNGVLFLDEVCEFDRNNIESLRIPIEEKSITHFRKGMAYSFPCNFQLIMASNPCKCGYYGDGEKLCKCTEQQIIQYQKKLSGPMMDRIDLRIQMEKVQYQDVSNRNETGLDSKSMRENVIRGIRYAESMGRTVSNGNMSDADIEKYCALGEDEEALMKKAYDALKLSPRSYKKVLKVARTIADMDESEKIRIEHLAEALSYRIEI